MEELGSLLVAEPVLLVAGQHGVRLECGELLKGGVEGGRESGREKGREGEEREGKKERGGREGGRRGRQERERGGSGCEVHIKVSIILQMSSIRCPN